MSDSLRSQRDQAPVTGDWVVVIDRPDVGPAIDRVLPRRRTLVRRDPSEEVVEQPLVANIDAVAVVHGLDRPLSPGRIERFLVLALDSGAEPVVVLTKADEASDDVVAEVEATVRAVAGDARVLVTRVDDPSTVEPLREHSPPGATLVLVGESGTGKSTLVNVLVGDDRQQTGEVRDRDAAGRHTTVTRDLVSIPGGGIGHRHARCPGGGRVGRRRCAAAGVRRHSSTSPPGAGSTTAPTAQSPGARCRPQSTWAGSTRAVSSDSG